MLRSGRLGAESSAKIRAGVGLFEHAGCVEEDVVLMGDRVEAFGVETEIEQLADDSLF